MATPPFPWYRFLKRLEHRWATPTFGGWVLLGLTVFFFGAATNTLAGWLYAMSALGGVVLLLSALLPMRSLGGVGILRQPMEPVSVGQVLRVSFTLSNPSPRTRVLLKLEDHCAPPLGEPIQRAIATLPARSTYALSYSLPTQRRGIFLWRDVVLETGAPLGLFSSRRWYRVPATAVIYPRILPLRHCPILDALGQEQTMERSGDRHALMAATGNTRGLRPYRWGDPLKLVHWRTSARHGELRVREMETLVGNQDVIVALDNQAPWNEISFEQAVEVAASLQVYGGRRMYRLAFWSPTTGLIRGDRPILEALAGLALAPRSLALPQAPLPRSPLLWLAPSPASPSTLPGGSRQMIWGEGTEISLPGMGHLIVQGDRPLLAQLQQSLR